MFTFTQKVVSGSIDQPPITPLLKWLWGAAPQHRRHCRHNHSSQTPHSVKQPLRGRGHTRRQWQWLTMTFTQYLTAVQQWRHPSRWTTPSQIRTHVQNIHSYQQHSQTSSETRPNKVVHISTPLTVHTYICTFTVHSYTGASIQTVPLRVYTGNSPWSVPREQLPRHLPSSTTIFYPQPKSTEYENLKPNSSHKHTSPHNYHHWTPNSLTHHVWQHSFLLLKQWQMWPRLTTTPRETYH